MKPWSFPWLGTCKLYLKSMIWCIAWLFLWKMKAITWRLWWQHNFPLLIVILWTFDIFIEVDVLVTITLQQWVPKIEVWLITKTFISVLNLVVIAYVRTNQGVIGYYLMFSLYLSIWHWLWKLRWDMVIDGSVVFDARVFNFQNDMWAKIVEVLKPFL